jgi:heme oxygenase
MAERTSDRALLNEAIDLLCGCAPMAWTAKNLNDAAEYEKQITAFIARVRTLDAAPSEPNAEHWRRAIGDIFGPDMVGTIEQRASKLAKEGGSCRL